MHENVKVTKDYKKKLQVHTIYNNIKGGVDVVDLLSTSHSTTIKSKRWPLIALAFIFSTCRSNAKIILGNNNIKLTNFKFTYNTGKALVLLSVEQQCHKSNELQIRIMNNNNSQEI